MHDNDKTGIFNVSTNSYSTNSTLLIVLPILSFLKDGIYKIIIDNSIVPPSSLPRVLLLRVNYMGTKCKCEFWSGWFKNCPKFFKENKVHLCI